jgi:hypothetical protein
MAGYVAGRDFTSVTIVPDEDAGSLGHVSCTAWRDDFTPEFWSPADDDDTPELIERDVITSLAGMIAERRFRGRYNHVGAADDLRQAVSMADYLSGDPRDTERYLNRAWERAEALLAEHWPAVETLAAALLERQTLTGDEAREIIAGTLRPTQAAV